MKKLIFLSLLLTAFTFANAQTIYQFKMNDITGKSVNLSEYKGKVVLVVNTASKCGFTPQYEGLEALYKKYKDKGLVILAFPCNQFLGQEPGSAEEIQNFCSTKYDVTFPIFEKTDVNGAKTNPLYSFLKTSLPLEGKNDIRWNFEKFLIDKNGKPVQRYASKVKPEELEAEILKLLGA